MNFQSLWILGCAPLLVGACTSVKSDDHSYTYVYQHQTTPPREVTETVTTKTVRTRHYSPRLEEGRREVDSDPAPREERRSGATDREILEGLRSDPFTPPRGSGSRDASSGSETGMVPAVEPAFAPGEPEWVPVPVFDAPRVAVPAGHGIRPGVSAGIAYPVFGEVRPVVVGVPVFGRVPGVYRPASPVPWQPVWGGSAPRGWYPAARLGMRTAGGGCSAPRMDRGGVALPQAPVKIVPAVYSGGRIASRM
jgi:hypothetical protein